MAEASRSAVLVVDDEALVAFDVADQCEAAGFDVIGPALTLKQGMAMAEAGDPSIALLDINLRDELVWPLARLLRQRSVPIVFISANCSHPEIRDEFPDATCLDKPVDSLILMAAVRPLVSA
ncbi:response regulator [Croceicoccus marinus]|uniref:Response regulator n=1 Tax=Croceicoccus marinus TaxID=450378 RepID=A0A7G6VRX0_9SPHN|nr:response regulator [Croceicoccus marinus]QNE04485.1 response regulator [Croceicoccus marinus]